MQRSKIPTATSAGSGKNRQSNLILPFILIVPIVVGAGLYLYFSRRRDSRDFWRIAFLIGLGIGVARAALASIGWYTVERTGGPLQVPGFALAMLAWPEAVILPRHRVTPVPTEFYVLLSLLLVASSVMLVGLVALVARVTRRRTR